MINFQHLFAAVITLYMPHFSLLIKFNGGALHSTPPLPIVHFVVINLKPKGTFNGERYSTVFFFFFFSEYFFISTYIKFIFFV